MKTANSALLVFSLFLGFLLSGCAGSPARFWPMTPGGTVSFGSPRPASEVGLFVTQKPDYKYRELGMITYEALPSMVDEPAIYEIMREKAGEIGADGLIIMPSQTSLQQTPNVTYDYWGVPIIYDTTRSLIIYRGMAIQKI